MKTFIQSASVEELRRLARANLLDGIALSLVDLGQYTSGAALHEYVGELAQEFALPILAPVTSITAPDMYREGRDLAKRSDHVIVQIPFVEDAVVPIRTLVADGVRVCATYIYNGAQAFLASKIGATIVMVPVDDLDSHGQPSSQIVSEIRDVIDAADLECELGISSPRSATHFTGCLLAGADLACMSPDVMQTLITHAFTDRGIDKFLSQVSKYHHGANAPSGPRGVE